MNVARNRRPALTTNHFADYSGGVVSDSIEGVRSFAVGGSNLAEPDSARYAFGKVIAAAYEIANRVKPGVLGTFGDGTSGEVSSLGAPTEGGVAMDITEANEHRVAANNALYTASVLVQRFAEAKGIAIPHRSNITGDILLEEGDVFSVPAVEEKNPQRSGLMKPALDAALQRWADDISTLVAVVNAAPSIMDTPASVITTTETSEPSGDE